MTGMDPSPRPRVKICCILGRDEAALAIRHGAHALGLVSAMPSGPGVISEERIAEIAASVPPAVATFLLTSEQHPDAIIAQQRWTRVSTVQLCDRLEPGAVQQIRHALPGVKLVQVVHVQGPEALEEACEVAADDVDAVLLDSGNLTLPVKELGGTGRTHDWDISARIREAVPVPVFLAGGLRPDNVAEAVKRVRPFAVDLCSGVRTDGILDERKLSAFMDAVRSAQE